MVNVVCFGQLNPAAGTLSALKFFDVSSPYKLVDGDFVGNNEHLDFTTFSLAVSRSVLALITHIEATVGGRPADIRTSLRILSRDA